MLVEGTAALVFFLSFLHTANKIIWGCMLRIYCILVQTLIFYLWVQVPVKEHTAEPIAASNINVAKSSSTDTCVEESV